MAQTQIKEKLNVLIDSLPTEQAELVLDFAVLLRQRQAQAVDPNQTAIEANPWKQPWLMPRPTGFSCPRQRDLNTKGKQSLSCMTKFWIPM
ncbi:MAG: hypothetical protein R2932_49735 [Caldilineaceae bacterium]